MANLVRPLIGLLVLSCLGGALWFLFRGRAVETEYAVNREAGKNLAAEGSYAEATTHLHDALDAARQLDPKDERVDQAIADLADAYGAQGEYVETQHLHMEALQRTIEKYGPESPQAGAVFNRLGRSTALQGNHAVAEGMYNQAIAVWDKIGTDEHLQDAAESHEGLAATVAALERDDEAEKMYARALELREKQLGAESPLLAPLLRRYADVLTRLNRIEEAQALRSRADVLMPPTPTPTITSTPTMTHTETLTPTDTPVPTDTPQPPSATPKPATPSTQAAPQTAPHTAP